MKKKTIKRIVLARLERANREKLQPCQNKLPDYQVHLQQKWIYRMRKRDRRKSFDDEMIGFGNDRHKIGEEAECWT